MIKVLYFVSDVNKSLSYEWVVQYLDKKRFDLSFILLNSKRTDLESFLEHNNIPVKKIHNKGKRDWLTSIIKAYFILKKLKPDVVHCHMLQANVVGLISSKLAGVKKRIYTRHHSSEHHIYFPRGVWLDRLSNHLATHIIAISQIVKKILLEWEKVDASKVFLIPHGFLLYEFSNVDKARVLNFKYKYLIENGFPIIGVISRFTEWKGIQYIIPAFKKLLVSYPNSILLLLNSTGDYENEIMNALKTIPENSYRLIPFENDIAAAYQAFDAFVHVPINDHSEAFGQIYIEALSAGIPSVFTKSGIANDAEFNENIAKIVDFKNADLIYNAIKDILENKIKTNERILAGKELAAHFNLIFYIERIEQLYGGDSLSNFDVNLI